MKNIQINKSNTTLIAASAALFLAFLWAYSRCISDMVKEWSTDPNNSHGFIIPAIACYFIWNRRERLKGIELKPANWGIILLLTGIILYILSYLGAAYTAMRVSMLIVMAGGIIFIYGKSFFKGIAFPFLFLFLMIPVPRYLYDAVAFPLKIFVTKYAVLLLSSMGVLVFREGNIIMLENITLQVVEACSGIRSLTSILVVGIILAYISQKSKFARIILVLFAIVVAIFANIMRIVITGFLAKSYGSGAAEGFFHEFAGLGVFSVEILLLCITAYALNRIEKKSK